ncbi:MAG: alpha/beta fold hydrolase [Candidatus Limnocylindrales bacterium]
MSNVRPPEPYIVHDGLAVYRVGDGSPVLLMPAPHRYQIPGDGSATPLIEGLTALGRQVISFDPPASGRSSRPMRLSMSEMHDCADEALAACGISGPVDSVGHSMAGLTVLAYAIERPQHVRRLVLIGTGTGGRAYMSAPGALWNHTHPRFWRLAALGILQMTWRRRATEVMLNDLIQRESFVDKRFAGRTPLHASDWFRPRGGHTEWHDIALRLDYGPRLGEIDVPTLILCGRHDPQYAPACSEELAAGIRGSQLAWFEHSGHFSFIEEPEAMWSRVAAFLQAG